MFHNLKIFCKKKQNSPGKEHFVWPFVLFGLPPTELVSRGKQKPLCRLQTLLLVEPTCPAHKLCTIQMSGIAPTEMGFLCASRAKLSLHLSDDGVVGEYFNQLIPTCRHPKLYAKGRFPFFASSHHHHQLLCSSQRIHKGYSRFCPGTKPSPSSHNLRRDSHET